MYNFKLATTRRISPVAIVLLATTVALVGGSSLTGGLSKSSTDLINTRIFQGEPIVPGQFPFLAKVNFDPFCSGAIISARHILTTGPCIQKITSYDTVKVTVGDFNETILQDGEEHIFIDMIHTSADNHLAIIELKHDFDPTTCLGDIFKAKAIITLPAPGRPQPQAGEMLTIVGRGLIDVYGNQVAPTSVPHYTTLPVVSDNECKEISPELAGPNFMCAGYYDTIRGPAENDLGAPLVREVKDAGYNKYELIGLTYKYFEHKPKVFLKVTEYESWINEVKAFKQQIKCSNSTKTERFFVEKLKILCSVVSIVYPFCN